jgi:hypothetical protein
MKDVKPIFLISLPRSGSTLLQKILTTHPDIYSISETWIILPLSHLFEKKGIKTLYSHQTFSIAMEDIINAFPVKEDGVLNITRSFILEFYKGLVKDEHCSFFLDKTPRYYLIIPFLFKVFPDAKYVFLFRNPLDVLASIVNTWHDGRLKSSLRYNLIDIYRGPKLLSEGFEILKERAVSIDYADLVHDTENVLKALCAYLEISFSDNMIHSYNKITLHGRLGDVGGTTRYKTISEDSVGIWKHSLNNFYRKRFVKRYVRHLGDETLQYFNTSQNELLSDLKRVSAVQRGNTRDIVDSFMRMVSVILDSHQLRGSMQDLLQDRRFYPYS